MAKYKICYSGFAYVEADSEEEAEEKYSWGDTMFDVESIDFVKEVDEFVVEV